MASFLWPSRHGGESPRKQFCLKRGQAQRFAVVSVADLERALPLKRFDTMPVRRVTGEGGRGLSAQYILAQHAM